MGLVRLIKLLKDPLPACRGDLAARIGNGDGNAVAVLKDLHRDASALWGKLDRIIQQVYPNLLHEFLVCTDLALFKIQIQFQSLSAPLVLQQQHTVAQLFGEIVFCHVRQNALVFHPGHVQHIRRHGT